MKINNNFGKWLGIFCATISLGVGVIFYFNRTFFDEDLLNALTLTQDLSGFAAFILGLLSIRYWQGIVTLVLLIISIYMIFNINVGIH